MCSVFRAGELQEYLFETHGRGPQFVQVPTRLDYSAGQIATDKTLSAFDLEGAAVLLVLLSHDAAYASNLFEPSLYGREIEAAIASADFDQDLFCSASAILQVVH